MDLKQKYELLAEAKNDLYYIKQSEEYNRKRREKTEYLIELYQKEVDAAEDKEEK